MEVDLRTVWISLGVIAVTSRNWMEGAGLASALEGKIKTMSMIFILRRVGLGEFGRDGTLSSFLDAIFLNLQRSWDEALETNEFQWSCIAVLMALK